MHILLKESYTFFCRIRLVRNGRGGGRAKRCKTYSAGRKVYLNFSSKGGIPLPRAWPFFMLEWLLGSNIPRISFYDLWVLKTICKRRKNILRQK
jgi:hypothetical protein